MLQLARRGECCILRTALAQGWQCSARSYPPRGTSSLVPGMHMTSSIIAADGYLAVFYVRQTLPRFPNLQGKANFSSLWPLLGARADRVKECIPVGTAKLQAMQTASQVCSAELSKSFFRACHVVLSSCHEESSRNTKRKGTHIDGSVEREHICSN